MQFGKHFCAGAALLLILCAAPAFAYDGIVVRVADGDTLTVSKQTLLSRILPQNATEEIRVYGIDCPEMHQAYGVNAKEITQALTGQRVDVQPMYIDKYKRTVAIVTMANGETLQERLLRAGAAWVYPQFCKISACKQWKQLERTARQNNWGLWAVGTAVPPWEWRKSNSR